jgi:hypothetical protein
MLKVFQFIDSQSAQNTGLIYRPGGEAKVHHICPEEQKIRVRIPPEPKFFR